MNEVKYFYQTPLGKIISAGVHDINSGLGLISAYRNFIKKDIEKGTLTNESLLQYLEKMREAEKRIREATDYIYDKTKELTMKE